MSQSINTAGEYGIVDHEEIASSPDLLKIREWLQPTDYLADSGEFRRHLASKAPGTGLWICETDEYRKWHDSPDHGSLWIKGVPGAGKSVMAASLIHHLWTTENCPVLFFFFRNIVAANFSPRALIQDWLTQLLPYSSRLQASLQSRLETKLDETSDNDLIDIFLDGVSSVPKLYCVGDALDEMTTENRPFLDKLNSLATHRPRSLKLLVTSRPKQYLQSALRDSSIVHISLQQRLVDADILSYLHHRFDTALISEDKLEIKQQLIDMVAKRSEGLFLYAKLTMDQIQATLARNGSADITALQNSLPVGLEQTYTSMLAKQRQDRGISTDIQVLVFEAVTHSSRPLRLNELASLIQYIHPDLDAPAGFKALIATCCGPLIEVLEDETLQVIHHSFTEFLRGNTRNNAFSNFPVIDSLQAHKRMAINCLRYLRSGTLLLPGESAIIPAADLLPGLPEQMNWQTFRPMQMGMEEEEDAFKYRDARLRYPFLHYAVENWAYHVSHYDIRDDEFFSTIQDFIKPDNLAFRRWLVLQWGSSPWKKGSANNIPTVLDIAAFAGMSELVSRLIEQDSSVSSTDEKGRTPLHWAAANGHVKVVSLLIQHGCDPDAAGRDGLKPLHLAAKKNHVSVVRALLEAGVQPNTCKGKIFTSRGPSHFMETESAMLYASEAGHKETLTAMIPFCNPEALEQLLCECCRFGRTEAVKVILAETDVSANASYRGGSALHFACVLANVKCAEALIDRGADVHKMSGWEPPVRRLVPDAPKPTLPPLQDLVRVWNKNNNGACLAIFKKLLEAGVDLEQLNNDGNTALIKALQPPKHLRFGGVYVPAIKALLDAGANVKATTQIGDTTRDTALHIAAEKNQDLEAMRLLIEHGADVNQRNSEGTSTLHMLMLEGNTGSAKKIENAKPIIKLLLEKGADPESRDNMGWTPMSRRPTRFGAETFGLLLSKCKYDSTKRDCWFSLLEEQDNSKFAEALEVMIAAGMGIDERGDIGRTLYLDCLAEPEKREILREHGARTDLSDSLGNNAIHLLTPTDLGTRSVLESLFAEGHDPASTNYNGDTLLHRAASYYHMSSKEAEDVRWLISLGIPINAANKQGDTALHLFMKDSWQRYRGRREDADFIDIITEATSVDFGVRNNDGLTVLHLAVMRSEVHVSMLMARADLSALTRDFQNVLHLACRARKTNIVAQILGSLGTLDVNQKDSFGRTPLHYACASGEAESVALLLKHGGDANAVDADDCTLLHACAEATAEKRIWDFQDQPFEWMRGPGKDPLRPSASIKNPREREWISDLYTQPRAPAPAVGTILKMLLDAGVDPAATNGSSCTALDVAIQEGCAEFVEVFYRDEELFDESTTHVEENVYSPGSEDVIRQQMKTQMAMMLPRSCLEVLGHDKSAMEQVANVPALYLEVLTHDDTVSLVNQGFEADPTSPSHYLLLEELMKPGRLQLVKRFPHVIAQYSTHESLGDKMIREKIKQDVLNPLQMACAESECNLLTIRHLVEELHVDVNVQYAHKDVNSKYRGKPAPGGTALHILASADSYWQLEAMKYLIAHGADVNASDGEGQCPIHIAARGKKNSSERIQGFWRLEALRILLDSGADINVRDEKGRSALHKASTSGDATRELLQRGANPTLEGRSPLFTAIDDQNLEALEALLDQGLSVDTKDPSPTAHVDGSLPRKACAVLCAAFADKVCTTSGPSMPSLCALVERGANLYLPLNDKETLLHCLFEMTSVADTLLKEPCVSRIDFDRRDQLGRTVLMVACARQDNCRGYGSKSTPKVTVPPLRILDCGADATLTDHEGKTALHHLLDNVVLPDGILMDFIEREEVAPTLWQRDNHGFTPFHHAIRNLRPTVCNLLLSKGADISEADPNGLTALHHIAPQCIERARYWPNHHGIIKLPGEYPDECLKLWKGALAEGVSINAVDNAGNTPLLTYLASPESMQRGYADKSLCHVEHFDMLFPADSGVDISAVNHQGETALHIIAARERSEYTRPGHDKALFEILLARGVDPLREDAKGRTALDIASACGDDDIVELVRRS